MSENPAKASNSALFPLASTADVANNSVLVSSLREFQVELDTRNALALQELNRQIDHLASIPIDSSLPEYKDGLEFTSPPSSFRQLDLNPPVKDYAALERDLDKLRGQSHALDDQLKRVVAAEQTRLALEDRLDNILNLRNPLIEDDAVPLAPAVAGTAQVPPATNGGQPSRESPITPMDFGDSIARKIVDESFVMPSYEPTPVSANPSNAAALDLTRSTEALARAMSERAKTDIYSQNLADFSARLESIQKIPSATGLYSDSYRASEVTTQPIAASSSFTVPQSQTQRSPHAVIPVPAVLPTPGPLPSQTSDRVGLLESEKAAAKEKIVVLEKELASTRHLLLHQQQLYQRSPVPVPTRKCRDM
ncbi:hypothetical protein HDU91_001496 [Kappamyces sp. JEL0680]|nr:hypothetical protein HDU91_001496 [Kappamyces sp. JEL0680]